MGTELFTETLITPALDEVSTEYGLLAEAVSYPDDRSSVTYRLRANARWHDGKPVTPEDVIFSFDTFKTNSPFYGAYYRHVIKAEKTGEREVTFTFDGPGNRELPQIVGQLPVLPKHWWEGTDKSGKKRDVDADHAGAAARLGPLSAQGFRARPHDRLREGRRLLGQGPQRQHRHAIISRQIRLRIFPRLHRRAGGIQGRSGRLAHREQRQELGDLLRFSRRARQEGGAGGIPDPQFRRDAGFRLQYPARQVQGPARAPRLQFRLRFRGDEQADFLRPVQAHRQLFRRHRTGVVRNSGKARNSKSCKP